MELTRIGSNNWNLFSPVVYDAYAQNAPEVLRIGAIEDGEVCGSISLSYFMSEDQAFIDSLYVVPKFRKQGKGKALVEEAVRLTASRVHCLEAEFCMETAADLQGLFTGEGFACIPGEPIFDFDVKKLLTNKQYAKYCKRKLSGVVSVPYVRLSDAQRNRISDLLRANGERTTDKNVAGFSEQMSIAVYRQDDPRTPRACLLVTEYNRQVNIAQLYGSGKNNPKFLLAAILGFTEAVQMMGGAKTYDTLGMVAAHPGVKKAFELLFGKRMTPMESGLMHAIRFVENSNDLI
ncbi:MAG: GNAT family N-acetyltransferase [Lachnospiraceae bacterium]|nr:GNAT family N-acetyltransferase [Lachnospiraceae bacterium]